MSFRQKFVVAVVCFATSVAVVAQLEWASLGMILGVFWNLATGPLFPVALGGAVIVALLLYWNPSTAAGDARGRSR